MRILVLFFLFVASSTFNMSAQQPDVVVKRQKARFEKDQKDKQDAYILNFLNDLNVDDFQKEIIKQKLYSYVDATKVILKENTVPMRRQELIEQLDNSHFIDIKDMVSDETMAKIMDLIQNKNQKKNKSKKN